MKSITVVSKVINGSITRNRNKIIDAIRCFEGKDIEITIKRKRKTRTTPQNAYMWGVIIPLTEDAIKKEWGEVWSKDKVHEFYKNMFLFHEKINEETGEVVRVPKSTTENTTVEQDEYHSQCREFLKEWFNVDCPLPNEEISLNI